MDGTVEKVTLWMGPCRRELYGWDHGEGNSMDGTMEKVTLWMDPWRR